MQRRYTVRSTGAAGSDNLGLSSEKQSEKLCRRKSKVSWGRLVHPGLVGPKPRPKGVGDGQQVDIPVPPTHVMTDGGTRSVKQTMALVDHGQARRATRRKIRVSSA